MPVQSDVTDLSEFTAPSSDQLNADDLLDGPRVFTFRRIARGAPDPKDKNKVPKLIIHVHEASRPWKPCKGMQRLMVEAWGKNPAEWPDGCRVELFRDPSVAFGDVKLLDDNGDPVLNDWGKPITKPNITGGVRICGLYPQEQAERDYIVTTGRGQRKVYRVRRLDPPKASRPTLAAVLSSAGLTLADLDAYVTAQGKPATSSLPPDKQQATADALSKAPDKLAAVRAHRDAQQQPAPFDRAADLAEIKRLEPTVSGAEALADAHGIGADLGAESDATLTSYLAALRAAAQGG